MGLFDRPQSIKKIENQRQVLEYFDKHGGTIQEIADALNLSRSSVQRYLNDVKNPEKLKIIKEYLKANKEEGNKNGGRVSQERNTYDRNELGLFIGSRKK